MTLTFDDVPKTRDRLKELQTHPLITLGYILCSPDFERENFSAEELTEVVFRWALDCGLSIPVSNEHFSQKLEGRFNRSSASSNVAKEINGVLKEYLPNFHIEKGKEWGERLADFLSHKRDRQVGLGTYSENDLSKIERQIFLCYRVSQPYINYPMSIDHLEITELELKL